MRGSSLQGGGMLLDGLQTEYQGYAKKSNV
jgi:hypothetical protein